MLNVVLSAVAALVEKACTARSRAAGAVPSRRWCAANGARHAGAVRVRLVRCARSVVALRHRSFEIGVGGVDLRIDHRDRHVGAFDDAVHVGEAELLQDVLRGVALLGPRRAPPAPARPAAWSGM